MTTKRLAGPVALSTTLTTNVYQGGGGSALIKDVVRHIHVVNKTGSTAKLTLFLGATAANAAGTELFYQKAIAAYDTFDYYCALRMLSTDYLVGGSDTAAALTITVEGDQEVV